VKRVIVTVTNDLATDQRVHKTCMALKKSGFSVLEVGRILPGSLPLDKPYDTIRMKLLFRSSALFYAEYNIRLFFFLLFHKAHIIYANDLDTLPACWLAKRIKCSKIIYDTHEYYTHTPELIDRPFVQKFWSRIEKNIFPKIQDIITVNQSIANIYRDLYGKDLHVVRNIPISYDDVTPVTREELGIDPTKKMILLQGAGINIHRGAEEAVEAMQFVDDAILYIIGSGDVFPLLPGLADRFNVNDKVVILPRQTPQKLRQYTLQADLGLTIDKNTNPNYLYSLPNKLFDYIHSGVPVLASKLPEIERIINTYNIGSFISDHNPVNIANAMNKALGDKVQYQKWKENITVAARALCWDEEEKILLTIFERYA